MRALMFVFLLLMLMHAIAIAGPRTINVAIQNREVISPSNVVRVTEGDAVVLRWRSDEAVELHLHGYDVSLHLSANTPAEMQLDAQVSGRFPVTSHGFAGEHVHGHRTLLYLEVHPR